ncbi:phosphoenolpyruvate mutase [bacterium]|nr:phosphoenolpyruvate mutase [bacterium]
MKKSTQFKNLLKSNNVEFILEAHNGLSAKIVEESGFKGIWGSGLAISAALGVRDNNEASWTQICEVCEFMSNATSIPILLDGDTGFGNFNNFRQLVRKLEQIEVAGVCIEDKLFPKTNSFIAGEMQPLADIEEFCGKIRAGKDFQKDEDFVIAARVEAFIAGWGLEEALKRATAYADAGADAILMHSKISSVNEIASFMKHWDNRKPIIIVPTKYPDTPISEFEKLGISLVIWANHLMRTSITAMKNTAKEIHEKVSIADVEKKIIPVKEVFRLQNASEYSNAEEKYLPKSSVAMNAIILAASQGANFGSLTNDKPKTMLKIGNTSILSRLISQFNSAGIKNISVVAGYKKEAIDVPNIKLLENKEFDDTGILYSLYQAKDILDGPTFICFGDILFDSDILLNLIKENDDIILSVDSSFSNKKPHSFDAVIANNPYEPAFGSERTTELKNIKIDNWGNRNKYHGEFIGLLKLSSNGAKNFNNELEKLAEQNPDSLKKSSLNDFLNLLIENGQNISVAYSHGHWKDIDSIEDLTYLIDLYSKKQ